MPCPHPRVSSTASPTTCCTVSAATCFVPLNHMYCICELKTVPFHVTVFMCRTAVQFCLRIQASQLKYLFDGQISILRHIVCWTSDSVENLTLDNSAGSNGRTCLTSCLSHFGFRKVRDLEVETCFTTCLNHFGFETERDQWHELCQDLLNHFETVSNSRICLTTCLSDFGFKQRGF